MLDNLNPPYVSLSYYESIPEPSFYPSFLFMQTLRQYDSYRRVGVDRLLSEDPQLIGKANLSNPYCILGSFPTSHIHF